MFTADTLREALVTLGRILQARELAYELVVIGGGNLLLQGLIDRPTQDLDALAVVEHGVLQLARPMPALLEVAIIETARALGLDRDWLNAGPTDQLKQGIPDGFEGRTT